MLRRLVPWLILTVACVPAVQPYLGGPFPRTNDAATHLYRALELDRLIRAGVFFPRWAPDFAHGYGYPTFNYFPYLSHYAIEAFHLLGLPLLSAMRAVFALTLFGAGWTTYLLARDLFAGSVPAGLVAAVAYVYSPYLLYTAHVRGGLPEGLLLALLPLALLAVCRLARGEWRFVPLGSLTVAGMAFAHLGGFVQMSPFLALFGLVSLQSSVFSRQSPREAVSGTSHARRTTHYASRLTSHLSRLTSHPPLFFVHWALFIVSLLLGLALAAFHWMPAQAELGYVQLVKAYASAGIAYYLNFLRPGELFALPRLPVDLDLLNPPVVRELPLVACALALVAVFRWRTYPRDVRRVVFFFGFAFLASAFLTLDVSRFVWDHIPLLQQTLWPWRYLGPATLAAAVLAGAVVSLQSSIFGLQPSAPRTAQHASRLTSRVSHLTSHVSRLIPHCSFFIVSLFIATALPWLYPPRATLPEAPTLGDLARAEIPPLLVGTTTTGEYTPAWVKAWPDSTAMRAEQVAGREPERLDPASLAAGSTFAVTVRNSQRATYLLTLTSRSTVVYRTFYFPGWTGELDGRPLALRPTHPEGLISFDVPSGQHVVTLRFVGTPIQRTARAISLAALAFLLVTTAVGATVHRAQAAHRRSQIADPGSESTNPQSLAPIPQSPTPNPQPLAPNPQALTPAPQSPTNHLALRFTLYTIFLLASFLIPRFLLVRHGLRDGVLASAQHPTGTDFAGELTLLGYDLSKEAIRAADATTLNLYWKAQRPLGVPYGMSARLVDGRGLAWSGPDIRRPRDFRFFPGTDDWPAGEYILDPYLIQPLLGTPPGRYDLEVTVYRQSDLRAIGSERIGTLEITAPYAGSTGKAAPRASFGNDLALREYHFDRAASAPGEQALITLVWQTARPLPTDLRARLDLVAGASGWTVFSEELRIVEGFPTSRWNAGDVLADQVLLRLPAALDTDTYQWYLTVLDPVAQPVGARALLAPIVGDQPYPGGFIITAPPRVFTLPAIAHPLTVGLGDAILLRGYNLSTESPRPGEPFTVSLVWQASPVVTGLPASYHVFLHLTDAVGSIVAQSDGVPANWTRPTTGWVAGEVVADNRTLTLPAGAAPGEYRLWAGMADPASGQRLAVAGAADNRVPLGTLIIGPQP